MTFHSPLRDGSDQASPASTSIRPPWRRWVELGVLCVIPLLLIALLIPAIQRAKEAARRNQNRNKLKQIGLALHNYDSCFNTLPPGGTFRADGTACHGWMTSLLPYLDSSPVFSAIDMDYPWDHPRNATVLKGWEYPSYRSPYTDVIWTTEGWPLTHYAGNPDLLYRNSSVSLHEIADQSQTWIVGDVSQGFTPWPYPYNWRPMSDDLTGAIDGYGQTGNHGDFAMIDGSVRSISQEQVARFVKGCRDTSRIQRESLHEPTDAQTAKPQTQFMATEVAPAVSPVRRDLEQRRLAQ